ncbi:MAG: hypothetical protein Q9159_002197 [Coniocarpon cinnabarinum]
MDDPTASHLGQKRPRAEDEEPFTDTIIRETDRALSAYEYGDRDENEEITPQSSEKHLGGLQKLAKSSQHAAGIVRRRLRLYISGMQQRTGELSARIKSAPGSVERNETKQNARRDFVSQRLTHLLLSDLFPPPANLHLLPAKARHAILLHLIDRELREHEQHCSSHEDCGLSVARGGSRTIRDPLHGHCIERLYDVALTNHDSAQLVRERIDWYIAQTDQTINAVNSQLQENWNMGLSQGDVAMVNRATKVNQLTMARNYVARLSIPGRRIPDPEPARHPELPLENWLVILEPLIERALRDHERVFVHGPCMQRSQLLTTHLHLRNLFAIACMSRDIRNIVRRKILKWMEEVDERDERERFAMERGQRPGSAVRLSEGTLWRMRRRARGCVARLALPELPPMGELAVEERAERERQREAGGQR